MYSTQIKLSEMSEVDEMWELFTKLITNAVLIEGILDILDFAKAFNKVLCQLIVNELSGVSGLCGNIQIFLMIVMLSSLCKEPFTFCLSKYNRVLKLFFPPKLKVNKLFIFTVYQLLKSVQIHC